MKKINKILVLALMGLTLASCNNQANKDADEKAKVETKEEMPAKDADKKEEMPEETKEEDKTMEETEGEVAQPESAKSLPEFKSTDQDGNPFGLEDIAKNDATVINLWFTGCSACIGEMDELNKVADDLKKEDGVDFISMCTDVNYDESTKEAYQRIVKEKKPTYKAIGVENEGDMKTFLEGIFVYPTTIVVDNKGNIIGDPVEGTLLEEDQIAKLKENIKMAKESSQKNK